MCDHCRVETMDTKIRLMITRVSIILLLCSITATVYAKPKYIGNEACINCHKKEGLSWSKRAHAKAFEALKPGKRKAAKKKVGMDPSKDYTINKDCIRCHTTGYRKPGGFKNIKKTPNMKGVGCEACHGAGSKYKVLHDEKPSFTETEAKVAGELYAASDPEVCDKCHMHKDQHFTEQVDKKYKYNREEAIKDRKSIHDKFEKKFRSMF